MAAGANTAARRIAAALYGASAAYVLLRVTLYYLQAADTRRHHVEAASLVFVVSLIVYVLTADGATSAQAGLPPLERPRARALTALCFVAAAVLLYWPALFIGLFADDFVLVDAAKAGRFTVWSELFRPSIFVVWRLLLASVPEPNIGLHAANAALHGVNAFLVHSLARAIGLSRAVAICAGVLFLCYPAAVEAVAWPSGIQDVLMSTCVLTVLVVAVTPARPAARFSWATIALLAGLLTKETAIAAPVLLLMLGLIPEVRKSAWVTAAGCAAVVAVFLAVRFSVLPLPRSYSPPQTRYAAKELLVRPFATLIVPFRVDETLRHPALGIVSAAFVVLLLGGAAATHGWRDRRPARAVAAAGMVLGAVAPVLAYFYVDPDLLGSRYLYLALTGWVLLLATAANALSSRAGLAIAPLVCLAVLWIPSTRSHLALWNDAGILRERILVAAAAAADHRCAGWIVAGVPAAVEGVPLFVNGFPEAARPALGEPIHLAPAEQAAGQCQLTWTGQTFRRD